MEEQNKTIAELIGIDVRIGISSYGCIYYYWNNPEMKDDEALPDYDCDWNELIKAIEFIESLGYVCVFYGNMCFIQDKNSFTKKTELPSYYVERYGTKIKCVYDCVYEFAFWYKQKG